jgi:hypothetical protein
MQRGDRVRESSTGRLGRVVALIVALDECEQPIGSDVMVRWDDAPTATATVPVVTLERLPA